MNRKMTKSNKRDAVHCSCSAEFGQNTDSRYLLTV